MINWALVGTDTQRVLTDAHSISAYWWSVSNNWAVISIDADNVCADRWSIDWHVCRNLAFVGADALNISTNT